MNRSVLYTLLFLPAAPALAACPKGYSEGHALSGAVLQLSAAKLADPAPPFENDQGGVELYGTGNFFLRYPSWKEFERGGCHEAVKLELYYRGKNQELLRLETPLDLRKFQLAAGRQRKDILIGGARASGDEASRRIFIFRQSWEKPGAWIRDEKPMTESRSHAGNLFQAGQKQPQRIEAGSPTYFFFEKETGLFVTRTNAEGNPEELPVFTAAKVPEGPRPIEVELAGKKHFLIAFSSEETIHFLHSPEPIGPYQPILSADGKELEDFGASLRKDHGLSGVARPALFRNPEGGYELLFHGQTKDSSRSLFKAPVALSVDKAGAPLIKILTRSPKE